MKYSAVLLITICLNVDIMVGEIMTADILKMLVLAALDQVSHNKTMISNYQVFLYHRCDQLH